MEASERINFSRIDAPASPDCSATAAAIGNPRRAAAVAAEMWRAEEVILRDFLECLT